MTQAGIPLTPDYTASRARPSDVICRAILAKSRSAVAGGSAERIAGELWPRDEGVRLVLRGSVSPADTAGGAALVTSAVADVFVGAPQSAGGQVLQRAL